MWPIEVIRAMNDPEKYAKTEEQKKKLKDMRNSTGFSLNMQVKKYKKEEKNEST